MRAPERVGSAAQTLHRSGARRPCSGRAQHALASTDGGQAGFSLLELVVAVAVLAVLAVGAALSTGRAVGGAEVDAERFRRAFEQHRALAVLAQEPRGLKISPDGLVAYNVRAGAWQAGATLYDWRGSAALVSGVTAGVGRPDLVLPPDGAVRGFAVAFRLRGQTWLCRADEAGPVTCAEG